MSLASPPAQTFFEPDKFYLRRAWGMTAKVSAIPDSRVAGVAHALRRRK
jgi:type IV secretory pathway protease TraF